MKKLYLSAIIIIVSCLAASARQSDSIVSAADTVAVVSMMSEYRVTEIPTVSVAAPEMPEPLAVKLDDSGLRHSWVSPYELPYTRHSTGANWHRMWINTSVLCGAFVGTLFVLELLPEDATAWNRASISQTPMFKRWFRNIFKRGPEWDHDNPIFNYVLHPYAGAAYFMSARSCGFSFWGSMLYSAAISTVGWEFGIEAFMERPSYQDIVITPLVGSLMGEGFYRIKHAIVDRGFEVLGSTFLGHFICFLIDPVNEVIDLFRGSPTRRLVSRRNAQAHFGLTPAGMSLAITF